MTPAEATSLAGRYTKNYGAGAFAFPTRKELEADPSQLRCWPGFVAVAKKLHRESKRRDFTGASFTLNAFDSTMYTHVARELDAEVPLLADEADYVIAYLDDLVMVEGLKDQGYRLLAATVSASSELKGVFHLGPEHRYPPYDEATSVQVNIVPPAWTFKDMLEEVEGLTGYRDDWPLYSDGSWGALCLKGFYPDDPGRDVKPSEMNKKWHAEHPGELGRTCQWTSLAADCPAIMKWLTKVPEWRNTGLERVRLLRMSGRGGKGGALGRHTDIADKSMGTADGQIVRFHLPLVTDPAIKLMTWDLTGVMRSVHLQAGRVYYLDARKPHAVINPTGVDRVHLVVDVLSSPEVRHLIASVYLG